MKYAFALRLQAGCGERLRRTHEDSRLRLTHCLKTATLQVILRVEY